MPKDEITIPLESDFDADVEEEHPGREEVVDGGPLTTEKRCWRRRRLLDLLGIKPVAVFWGLTWSVTAPVMPQLWIDKTCLVNLGYNQTVCSNLATDDAYEEALNQVEKRVNDFEIIDDYLVNIPGIIATLYLGIGQ